VNPDHLEPVAKIENLRRGAEARRAAAHPLILQDAAA
jgi:hypothetical protein